MKPDIIDLPIEEAEKYLNKKKIKFRIEKKFSFKKKNRVTNVDYNDDIAIVYISNRNIFIPIIIISLVLITFAANFTTSFSGFINSITSNGKNSYNEKKDKKVKKVSTTTSTTTTTTSTTTTTKKITTKKSTTKSTTSKASTTTSTNTTTKTTTTTTTKPVQYKITFMIDEGIDKSIEYKLNDIVDLYTPKKDGYKFIGWFYNNELVTSLIAVKDVELNAKFEIVEPSITITLNNEYYIGEDVLITSDIIAGTKDYEVKYYYSTDDTNYLELTNLNEIKESNTYIIKAVLKNNLNITKEDKKEIKINYPTLNIIYGDNKTKNHYYSANIPITVDVKNNKFDIVETKFYYSNKINNNYENDLHELSNLNELELGEYRITAIIKDSINNEFSTTSNIKIEEVLADKNLLFKNIMRDKIDTVYFDNKEVETTNVYDISLNEDNSIREYDLLNTETNMYEVHIVANNDALVKFNKKDLGGLFQNLNNATLIDLEKLDTRGATSMKVMFGSDYNLNEIKFGEYFDTSEVTNMSAMFSTGILVPISINSSLTNLDLSKFNTSKVSNFNSFLLGQDKLTEIDLTNFDMTNAKDLSYMFAGMENIETIKIDLSTSLPTNISYIFSELKTDNVLDLIKQINTSDVTNMEGVLKDNILEGDLDISSWDMSKVINYKDMFKNTKFDKIIVDKDYVMNNNATTTDMFKGMTGNIRNYNADEVDGTHANTGDTGYFTANE